MALNPEPQPIVQLLAKDQMKKTASSNGIDWDGHVRRMGAVAEVRVKAGGRGTSATTGKGELLTRSWSVHMCQWQAEAHLLSALMRHEGARDCWRARQGWDRGSGGPLPLRGSSPL